MDKRKKLARLNKMISIEILETKAILRALHDVSQSFYPANMLIEIAEKKLKNAFNKVEENRRILKITA